MRLKRDLLLWSGLLFVIIGVPLLIIVLLHMLIQGKFLSGGYHCGGALAWEDTNCDGWPDEGERRLSGICMWCGSHVIVRPPDDTYCQQVENQTMWEGIWWDKSDRCRFSRYVIVQPPAGLEPTTDTVQECHSGGIFGKGTMFGFALSSTCPAKDILTPSDIVRQRIIRGVILGALVVLLAIGIALLMYGRGKKPAERNVPVERDS